ncbi:MAG: transporter substrate-binding domain-containing protein [Deltaproteobacteria bacterium]|nr:transporter substrate-binding domain-containing protein [Candidatus Anaeroferrophillacea bacterium]
MFSSRQRDQRYDFTRPIFMVPVSIFVAADAAGITGMADLAGRLVAAQDGDQVVEYLEHEGCRCRLVPVANYGEAVEAIVAGGVDAVVGNEYSIWYHALSRDLVESIRRVGKPLYSGRCCMAVREGDSMIVAALDAALDRARDNGLLDHVAWKWLGTIADHRTEQYRLRTYIIPLAGILGFIVLLLAGIWWWNVVLRRRVAAHTRELEEVNTELEAGRARLQGILEANPDPMVIYDFRGWPVYLNPAFTRAFGWCLDDVAGAPIPFIPDDQKTLTHNKVRELFKNRNTVISFPTRRLTRSGKILDVVISAELVCPDNNADSEDTVMVVNFTDITEMENLRSRLRQAEKMEAIGTLAGGIAHDFNNILAAIMGFAELGREKILLGEVPVSECERVVQAAERARNLVRQLLVFSRQAEPEMTVVDLRELVEQTTEMVRRVIPKMVSVAPHIEAAPPPVVGDRHQLSLALLNLCSNAADAMPDGGTIRIEAGPVTLANELVCNACGIRIAGGSYVFLRVTDHGFGMDRKTVERMFDPFFTTKEVGKGTGLGLAAVFGIVGEHRAHIVCDSEPGRGTEITIYLPTAGQVPAAGGGAGVEATVTGVMPRGTETILLVDDEDDVREVGRILLEGLGYEVLLTASAEDALAVYDREQDGIDLVILDLNMPGMGGEACLRELRRRRHALRVIIASGWLPDRERQDAAAQGIVQLAKPYSLSRLATAIRELLDDRSVPAGRSTIDE